MVSWATSWKKHAQLDSSALQVYLETVHLGICLALTTSTGINIQRLYGFCLVGWRIPSFWSKHNWKIHCPFHFTGGSQPRLASPQTGFLPCQKYDFSPSRIIHHNVQLSPLNGYGKWLSSYRINLFETVIDCPWQLLSYGLSKVSPSPEI